MQREAYIALHQKWEEKLVLIRILKKEADVLADRLISASLEPDTPLINFSSARGGINDRDPGIPV